MNRQAVCTLSSPALVNGQWGQSIWIMNSVEAFAVKVLFFKRTHQYCQSLPLPALVVGGGGGEESGSFGNGENSAAVCPISEWGRNNEIISTPINPNLVDQPLECHWGKKWNKTKIKNHFLSKSYLPQWEWFVGLTFRWSSNWKYLIRPTHHHFTFKH